VDFAGLDKDYGTGPDCVKFISAGNGRGQCVKNNAASAWNRKSEPCRGQGAGVVFAQDPALAGQGVLHEWDHYFQGFRYSPPCSS
jgi:hypothetical protein